MVSPVQKINSLNKFEFALQNRVEVRKTELFVRSIPLKDAEFELVELRCGQEGVKFSVDDARNLESIAIVLPVKFVFFLFKDSPTHLGVGSVQLCSCLYGRSLGGLKAFPQRSDGGWFKRRMPLVLLQSVVGFAVGLLANSQIFLAVLQHDLSLAPKYDGSVMFHFICPSIEMYAI